MRKLEIREDTQTQNAGALSLSTMAMTFNNNSNSDSNNGNGGIVPTTTTPPASSGGLPVEYNLPPALFLLGISLFVVVVAATGVFYCVLYADDSTDSDDYLREYNSDESSEDSNEICIPDPCELSATRKFRYQDKP